jgi:hypothetical protein
MSSVSFVQLDFYGRSYSFFDNRATERRGVAGASRASGASVGASLSIGMLESWRSLHLIDPEFQLSNNHRTQ